jgi:hypothetical protein
MLRSMRTTLTLDDDVAALLRRVQSDRKASLKEVVNEALRRGLQQIVAPVPSQAEYRTPSLDLGRSLIGSLDNTAEVLALIEGEAHR